MATPTNLAYLTGTTTELPGTSLMERAVAALASIASGTNPDGTVFASPIQDAALTADTQVTGTSGNVAASPAVATLPAVAGKFTYVTGFEFTAAGASAALDVIATLVGCVSGTLSYIVVATSTVTTAVAPLIVQFSTPIASSAVNTAITLTVPSLGSGNTNACANIHGFYQ